MPAGTIVTAVVVVVAAAAASAAADVGAAERAEGVADMTMIMTAVVITAVIMIEKVAAEAVAPRTLATGREAVAEEGEGEEEEDMMKGLTPIVVVLQCRLRMDMTRVGFLPVVTTLYLNPPSHPT